MAKSMTVVARHPLATAFVLFCCGILLLFPAFGALDYYIESFDFDITMAFTVVAMSCIVSIGVVYRVTSRPFKRLQLVWLYALDSLFVAAFLIAVYSLSPAAENQVPLFLVLGSAISVLAVVLPLVHVLARRELEKHETPSDQDGVNKTGFQAKVSDFEKDMARRGRGLFGPIPAVWRLLWRFGVELPPPVFLPFLLNVFLGGCAVLLITGIPMLALCILVECRLEILTLMARMSGLAGVLLGFLFGLYWAIQRRKLRLPSWSRYPH